MTYSTKLLLAIALFLSIDFVNGQTVTNGQFNGTEAYSTVAPGWTQTSGSPDLVNIPSVLVPALTYTAVGAGVSSQGGNMQLVYEANGGASTERLRQSITGFVVGTTYTLTYEEANFGPCYGSACYTKTGTILVNISGIPQMTSGNQMAVSPTWYSVCLSFVATSTTHTIEFEANCLGLAGGLSGSWMALDNVQISSGGSGGNASFAYPASSLCISSPITSPSSVATPGGTFSASPAGLVINSTTGAINPSLSTPGTYTITYTLGGCFAGSSTATINIVTGSSAGPDNSASICNSAGSTIDLNTTLVGAAPGGTWTETTSSGSFNTSTAIFNASGQPAGVYTFTYTVPGTSACPADQAIISVTVQQQQNAGADITTTICNNPGSTSDLNTLITGSSGGVWAELTASGGFNATTGILNANGIPAGTYNFTYTLPASGACPSDQALIDVSIEQTPNAGADNSSSICNSAGSTIDLNSLVVGTAGGTWTETTTSGSFDPSTGVFDASGQTAGVYTFTYDVLGSSVCPSDQAVFSITVEQQQNAGTDNSTTICNALGSTSDLNNLVTGAAGGIWVELTASGGFNTTTGILDASGIPFGTYNFTYTLPPTGACPSDQALIDVNVDQSPDAGADNSSTICNSGGSTIDLNSLVLGATGGTWTELTASGSFDPATGMFNASGLPTGTYNFTYNLPAAGVCPGDQALIDIVVDQSGNAGADNAAQICNSAGSTIDLNTLLSGADAGGTWLETTSSGSFNPTTGILNADGLAAGVYSFVYSTSSASACPVDNANFTITIEPTPIISPLLDEQVCDQQDLTPQIFGSNVPGSVFGWMVSPGGDIGFGLNGVGNIGAFTANNGSSVPVTSTVQVSAVSAFGCIAIPISFNITVQPLPELSFIADVTSGCAPLTVNFTNTSPASVNCVWDFGDGNVGSGCGVVSNTYANSGQYTVGLTVTSTEGCVNAVSYMDYIFATPAPVAEFSFTPDGTISTENSEITFSNQSQNATIYSWDFDDGSAFSSETNPVHQFPNTGGQGYTIMLIADNAGACPDTAFHYILIEDNILFFVPNSFTPDGDAHNHYFQPVFTSGFDPYDFHLTIFNRWGQVVFESYNAEQGWDGTFAGMGMVQDGTYVWTIEFKERMTDERHEVRGHVNLIR